MASPASSDEGEIRDGGSEKATTSLSQFDGTSVDRPDRTRASSSISRSPENGQRARDRRSIERSRSPYSDRAPRGSKRYRDDDYPDRSRNDPRRFKVHYEDAPQGYSRRSRVTYDDLDHGPSSSADLRYDERDRYDSKRPRTRSRSPYRVGRGNYKGRGGQYQRDENRHGGHANPSRSNGYGYAERNTRGSNDQSVSKRGQGPVPSDYEKHEAKRTQGYSQQHDDKLGNNLNLEKYVNATIPL